MKKYPLILILALLGITVQAQFNVYHPFPDSNAYWSENTWGMCPSYGGWYTYFDYHITGDTVINKLTYHKVNRSGGYSVASCPPPYVAYDYDTLYAMIREDTLKHIYMYCLNTKRDTLLYDFNLKVGDTLNQYACPRNDGDIVDSIDSIRIGSAYRKRYVIANTSSGLIPSGFIIEGIGSEQGLLEWMSPEFEFGSYLDCFQQNKQTLFPDSTTQCQLFYLQVPTIPKPLFQFRIYPNPASNQVTLSYQLPSSQKTGTLQLYNAVGQLIKSSTINEAQGTEVENVSALPNGIYYYTLSVNGMIEATNKLVIIK